MSVVHTITAGALLTALAGPVAAATFSFQQGLNGYAGAQDTTLQSNDPSGIRGADPEVSIDASDGGSPNHVLLRFDNLFGSGAQQIGADQQVISATLRVNVTSAGSGILFHDMLVNWSQSSATWNSLGEGVQANGIEAAMTPFLTIGANNSGSNVGAGVLDLDFTTALQRLQNRSVPGFGWVLLPFMPGGTNGIDFYSAEGQPADLRPLLTVVTLPVPEPASMWLWAAGALGLAAVRLRRNRA